MFLATCFAVSASSADHDMGPLGRVVQQFVQQTRHHPVHSKPDASYDWSKASCKRAYSAHCEIPLPEHREAVDARHIVSLRLHT